MTQEEIGKAIVDDIFDSEVTLYHHGVKGMKWGVVKAAKKTLTEKAKKLKPVVDAGAKLADTLSAIGGGGGAAEEEEDEDKEAVGLSEEEQGKIQKEVKAALKKAKVKDVKVFGSASSGTITTPDGKEVKVGGDNAWKVNMSYKTKDGKEVTVPYSKKNLQYAINKEAPPKKEAKKTLSEKERTQLSNRVKDNPKKISDLNVSGNRLKNETKKTIKLTPGKSKAQMRINKANRKFDNQANRKMAAKSLKKKRRLTK